jgi:hypothetical protein
LIGEAPSKSGDRYHHFPLSGAVAERLCGLSSIEPLAGESRYGQFTWALYECFECHNLFERYADATPWSAPAARERAGALRDEVALDRMTICSTFVLLGRRVAAAWPIEADFYEWVDWCGARVVVLPHPSGLNRMLNDEDHRAKSGFVLREAMAPR